MLRHADIWQAIDRLAQENGLSPSGLARKAGLDPTTFNKSKRIARDGKPRWPTTESLSKILSATESTLNDFVGLMADGAGGGAVQRLPIIELDHSGQADLFNEAGEPAGEAWDEVTFPDLADPHAYAIEVAGDEMEPVYRDGDVLIISPAAGIRRGDRVVVRTVGGEVLVGALVRKSAKRVELSPVSGADDERSFDLDDVSWVARVLWASQ